MSHVNNHALLCSQKCFEENEQTLYSATTRAQQCACKSDNTVYKNKSYKKNVYNHCLIDIISIV